MLPGGPERLKRVGVVTGAGGGMIREAIKAGLDALVTGEGAHHTYFEAMEGGINVYYGGHYATEAWGVRALGAHIEKRFGLPWVYHVHSPVSRDSERYWQNRVNSWVEKFCLRSATRVVVVSPSLEPYMIERGVPASKLIVIPNGVPVSANASDRPVSVPDSTRIWW